MEEFQSDYLNENLTEQDQERWEYYQRIKEENYVLKKELKRAKRNARSWKEKYANLHRKYKKETENKKPRYRNNGKGGK